MESQLAFVTNAFRYEEDTNPSIRAMYPDSARIVTLDTNLDEVGAIRRVAEELAAGGTTRVFEITVQQLYLPDDFEGAPPRFALYSPADGLNGEAFTAFEVSNVNLPAGTSTLKVR